MFRWFPLNEKCLYAPNQNVGLIKYWNFLWGELQLTHGSAEKDAELPCRPHI